jgi:hypothetical protein
MIQRLSRSLLTALAVVALSGTHMPAADQGPAGKDAKGGAANKGGKDAKPDGEKKTDQQKVQEATDDTTKGLGAICSILPLNQKNLDVKIPSFKDGKPASYVHADAMVRVDDDHMNLEGTSIWIYGETRADDLRVQLITGQYNMTSQVLASHQRSRVSRDDFQLEGDRMVFDTKSQQGKMEGNVHMIIHDTSALKNGPRGGSGQTEAEGQQEPAKPAKAKGAAKGTP